MPGIRRRLLIVINESAFFLSHRAEIASAAAAQGFDVHVATPPGAGVDAIRARGFMHHPIEMTRSGTDLLGEWRAFRSIRRVIAEVRPDIVHLVTMKPVIYGGVAARLARVPGVVAAIAGLGHLFGEGVERRAFRAVVAPLFRFALGGSAVRVIFQNEDDRLRMMRFAGLPTENTVLIRGSGVTLTDFPAAGEPDSTPAVVFASRLIWPKGVAEFGEAAKLLRGRGSNARFLLAGDIDPDNPRSLSDTDVERLRAEGVVEVLGHVGDIPALFAASHIVVLPSYYGEGLPKVLLEAAAAGRPVVTTDHPGCRDAIEPGVTGLLVPPRDAQRLADAIELLLRDPQRRQAMGRAARELAEREFGIERVVASHLEIYRTLGGGNG